MKKLLYISTALPDKAVEKVKQKQVRFSSNALNPISIFHNKIIDGVSLNYDEVTSIIGAPISKKLYNILYFREKGYKKNNIYYHMFHFLNLSGIKQLTIFLKTFFYVLWWNIVNIKHEKNIIIDGSYYIAMVATYFANFICRSKIAAIIVDVYSFMYEPNNLTGIKKVISRIYRMTTSKIDRFIFVTHYVEQLINKKNKPFMIMEGLIDIVDFEDTEVENFCLYAGGLHKIYGVDNLVNAFHETNVPFELHFYGNGDCVEMIKEISSIDSRIQYKGLVSHSELLNIEQKAKLLINPRPVYGQLDTRFNFPSKLMEYMQSGRPVLTTRLLGIPSEYDELMFYFDDDSIEALKSRIIEVLSMSEVELKTIAKKAQRHVNENKNNIVVGKKISELFG